MLRGRRIDKLILSAGKVAALAFVAVMARGAFAADVTVGKLLGEMVDYEVLTRLPSPYFDQRQASSFDRASAQEGGDWFANGDAGQFIRSEKVDGRTEWVMADVKGPGTVVRIWSANPVGTIRFYFDGEEKPRFSAKMAELLGGKVSPFTNAFSYVASSGWNLYFPFPYAKSLKVTVENDGKADKPGLYYHVNYRTYVAGTTVNTFTPDDLKACEAKMLVIGNKLLKPTPPGGTTPMKRKPAKVEPGGVYVLSNRKGPEAIRDIKVKVESANPPASDAPWAAPENIHNVLRTVIMTVECDGEKCVEVPVGDFFGSAPGINPFVSFPMDVYGDGVMACRFIMPYQKNVKISFKNEGTIPVTIQAEAKVFPYQWDERSLHFKSQWQVYKGSTRPMRDLPFLSTSGAGQFVGVNVHVANPVSAWWGEGDEKMYIDGEKFPSTFGTGSEDYFGYAWCDPTPFARPYHAQPRCDGPANLGHTSVNRWQFFDRMPYKTSYRYDMELWHWAECDVTYARTVYWYARPGTPGPVAVDLEKLLPPYIEGPAPVKGAIEGEKMKVLKCSGGTYEVQGGFPDLSAGKQLWWKNSKEGDVMELEFQAPNDGKFELIANCCFAADYGIHEITFMGVTKKIDFFGELSWKKVSLGVFDVKKGANVLKIKNVGQNEKAEPAHMFGLDYVLLEAK